MQKGEIYRLKKEFENQYETNSYNHPFIYWEDEGNNIRGIMLTTKNRPHYHNILLKQEHFKEGYDTSYGQSDENKQSFIAPLFLLKEIQIEHMEKSGELTEAGIKFIENNKSTLRHTDWQKHYANIKKEKSQNLKS